MSSQFCLFFPGFGRAPSVFKNVPFSSARYCHSVTSSNASLLRPLVPPLPDTAQQNLPQKVLSGIFSKPAPSGNGCLFSGTGDFCGGSRPESQAHLCGTFIRK